MTALVRLNLDIANKELKNSLRLRRAAESLRLLDKKYEKIVILSHRGRPEGRSAKFSLKPVSKALSLLLRKNVFFLDNNDLARAREAVVSGKPGIYMLENLRFLPGEKSMSPRLARELASFGNIFINDDFATAHRASASTVGITSFIKSAPGANLKTEVSAIVKAVKKPKRPFILVIGGVKVADKLGVIEALLPSCDKVLLGGGAGNTAMKAAGLDIGDSIFDESLVDDIRGLLKDDRVIYPADCRVSGRVILDIGPNTAALYADLIKNAGTVIWAGPVGNFERKMFSKGSEIVAKAMAGSKAFTLAGGGETTSAIMSLGLEKKLKFLSTGGGAMLDLLAGKKLPALAALKMKY